MYPFCEYKSFRVTNVLSQFQPLVLVHGIHNLLFHTCLTGRKKELQFSLSNLVHLTSGNSFVHWILLLNIHKYGHSHTFDGYQTFLNFSTNHFVCDRFYTNLFKCTNKLSVHSQKTSVFYNSVIEPWHLVSCLNPLNHAE